MKNHGLRWSHIPAQGTVLKDGEKVKAPEAPPPAPPKKPKPV